jgi:hypothetical protein
VTACPILALPRASHNCPSHRGLASGESLLPLPPDGGGARGDGGGRPIVGAVRSSPRGDKEALHICDMSLIGYTYKTIINIA